ncbi:hypothetical protein HOC35_05275 [Candidatus Woesearchaeota archaeon]|jgi:hypothetical protein|nr:hypothetical protein [Candidatus Woesearchaeota archaeon]
MTENSDNNGEIAYSVASFDPIWYRLFHRQIEAIKATSTYKALASKLENLAEKWHSRPSQDPITHDSYNPGRSLLPYVAAATLLTAIAVDTITDRDNTPNNTPNVSLSQLLPKAYTNNPQLELEQVVQTPESEEHTVPLTPAVFSQLVTVAEQPTSPKSIDQEFRFNIDNTDFANLPGGLQDFVFAYDRTSIDKALSDFRKQNGLIGEFVEGLLLYTQDAAHKELKDAGIDGRDAYTYRQMKPDVVATVHSIPGLKKSIVDDFPAIIGIESDFRADLGPNHAGACGLAQVTNDGGYYEFYHPLISNSKEARNFRDENPRLIAGMDYMFKDMLKHDDTRNLLAFYSEIYTTLDKEIVEILKGAKELRKERKYSDADQLEAEALEKKGLKKKAKSLRNFVGVQLKFVNKDFDKSDYRKRKDKLSSEKFDLDKTMKELVETFPELAESTGVEYKQGEDWVKHLDILPRLKDTWEQARFHPVLNVYMGAFVYALDDFRVNNHAYVQEHVDDLEVRQGLVQRSYNAGWYKIKKGSLNKEKLPTVADKYVKKHKERNRIFQQGHRTLYDEEQGIHAANTMVFEGQLARLSGQDRKFHSTNLAKVAKNHNVGQRNYR